MSEVFNWKRFSKWYLHDLKNIWKNYKINLLLTGLMPFSLFLVFGFVTVCFTGEWHLPDTAWRIMMFVVAGAIFIMSFPAMSYGNITDKKAGAQWILLPASREEKFISMMLNTLLLTPVVFLSMYACADAVLSFLGLAEGKTLYALFTEFNNDRVYIDIYLCSCFSCRSCLFQEEKGIGNSFGFVYIANYRFIFVRIVCNVPGNDL